MSISSLPCKNWRASATEPARGCFSFRRLSLHRLLSLSAEMTRSLYQEKPKGFILRPSVRKDPWSKCNHSTAFLKVKQQQRDLLDLGKHLKKKKKGETDHTLPEGSFLFLLRDGERWEKVLVGRNSRKMKTCLFSCC